MSFSTEKENPNSERFMLVKLTPARYISEDMADEGSGLYSIDWTFPIEKVQRNGVDLTETTSTPGTNDQWYWDGSSLKVKLAAAPSSSNVIVVFYNLFYTSGQYRITTADPEDPQTDEIHWEPRLEEEPAVKQSVKDIISGTLSTAITSIRLINADNAFQQYLTDNDSFYEKTVKCWLCINGVANIQKAFEGRIKKVNITKSRVTLTVYDIFSLLDQPALMGDTAEEAYWIRQAGSFPNMDPNRSGTPIRYIAGKSSRYKTQVIAGFANYAQSLGYEQGSLELGTCTSYSDKESSSTNLEWGLCRIPESALKTLVFGGTGSGNQYQAALTVSPIGSTRGYDAGGNYKHTYIQLKAGQTHNLSIGDTFKAERFSTVSGLSTAGPVYATVINDQPFTYGGVTYDYAVEYVSSDTINESGSNMLSFTSHSGPIVYAIRRSDNELISLKYTQDFTHTITATSGGNYYVKINLTSNVYTSRIPGFHPRYFDICYRIITPSSSTSAKQSAVLKKICDSSGLTTNATSFTATQAALDVNTAFSIPQFDEPDFASYRKYAEEICKSTLGVLSANNDFELEYQLLSAPSSSSAITEDRYLKESLAIDIDYQDIVTQLIAYNPHNSSESAIDAANSPSETVTSAVAEHLHGVKNTVRFRHVLETITDRIQDIFDILSQRRAIYSFSTSTDNLDSEIGDDLQLESPQLLGGESARDLKIISLDKSADRVDVEATDLLDI